MNTIYLGPWKQEEKYWMQYQKTATCHYHPLLSKKFNGNWLASPEIWYDNGTYCIITSYIDDRWDFGTLEKLKTSVDDNLMKLGWGLGEDGVVILEQEQFDKLNILA